MVLPLHICLEFLIKSAIRNEKKKGSVTMSIERARAYLKEFGMEERIMELAESSATVELAAEALHCEPERIAKTLSFLVGEQPDSDCGCRRCQNRQPQI